MKIAERHQKIVRLELRARHVTMHLATGFYRSAVRGNGAEFQEIREYVAGDDVRTIDWNVTARHNKPYVKRFSEERGQTLMLLLDGSASTRFGRKRETIAEVAAVLGSAAVQNQDKVGFIGFGAEVELYIPPANHGQQARRLIREALEFEPKKPGTNIALALEFLDRVVKRRSFAFLISDFFDDGFAAQLRVTALRHELVAVSVLDEREQRGELPERGLIRLGDPESERTMLVDSSSAVVSGAFREQAEARKLRVEESLAAARVDHLRLTAGGELLNPLVRFLRNHAKTG